MRRKFSNKAMKLSPFFYFKPFYRYSNELKHENQETERGEFFYSYLYYNIFINPFK